MYYKMDCELLTKNIDVEDYPLVEIENNFELAGIWLWKTGDTLDEEDVSIIVVHEKLKKIVLKME